MGITVLTLLAAVLAITPRERQLDIRVRVRKFDWLVVAVSFVLVLALEFYEFLQPHYSWLPPKASWWTGITPKNATYLVVLCEAAILGIRFRWAKLTPGKMLTFQDLVEELYWNGSYSELFALLQTHLNGLFQIYSADYFLPRLRAKLNPISSLHDTLSLVDELRASAGIPRLARSNPSFLRPAFDRMSSIAKYWGWRFIRLFPTNEAAQLSARGIVRGIFLSPKFLTALALTRPYLGLEIIKLSKISFDRSDFVDLFMKELLRDSHSVLFREIENNQNISGKRYEIVPSNKFLHFFLSDVKVAKELGIYKPIGDFVIAYLDGLTRNPQDDPYNRSYDYDFEQTGIWRSPLFLCIRFFDIMVKEALFQNMFWHMWLYYMPSICEPMVRNFRLDDPLVDEKFEFPTRYAYLLYLMFSSLRGWILALVDIPPDQTNIVLESTSPAFDENGNIPKCSIKALAQCLHTVLESKSVGDRTKRSLADMVFNIYFDLRASGRFDSYAEVLLTAMSEGNSNRRDNRKRRGLAV